MYALINGNKICTRAIYPIQIMAGLEAVYLIENVVRSLHICKRVVWSPTVCVGLQLIHEDRNDDHFAAYLQV